MKQHNFSQNNALDNMSLMALILLNLAQNNKNKYSTTHSTRDIHLEPFKTRSGISLFITILSICFLLSYSVSGQSGADQTENGEVRAEVYFEDDISSGDTYLKKDLNSNANVAVPNKPKAKYLFLDDHIIEEMEEIRRQFHRPEKKGIVLKPDQPWEGGRVSAFSVPIWVPEEGVYKWVYRPNYKNWSGLAISEDGINWEKPLLGIVEFEGSKENSIFSKRRIHKVVHDTHATDLNRRYKGIAVSTPVVSGDLVNWKDAAEALGGGDSGSLTYDEQGWRFLAPVKISDPSKNSYRAFELVTSKDFKSWSEPYFFFGADEKDQETAINRIRRWLSDPGRPRPLFVEPSPDMGWIPPEDIQNLPKRRHSWNAQCNNISVFPYHGQYIALITMLYPTGAWLPDHKNTSAFFIIEIATSRDLKTWNRFREPFIEPARLDKGVVYNYERMLISPVNRPLVKGDELWFYYTGGKEHGNHYSTYMDGTPRDKNSLSYLEQEDIEAGHSALYLATLRLDGFISLKAGQEGGYVITKPVELDGKKLYLNLACTGKGYAVVEIFNQSEEVIAVSQPVTGDGVEIQVNWKEKADLGSMSGQTVRFKIYLKEADLYSFWLE